MCTSEYKFKLNIQHFRFFVQGDECDFSHDCDQEVEKSLDICRAYLHGNCKWGDQCGMLHGQFPCKYHAKGLICYKGDQCLFSHDKPTPFTLQILEDVSYLSSNKAFLILPLSFYILPHLQFFNCQTFLISKSNLGGRVGKIFFILTQEDRTKNYFSHLPNINFEKIYIYCETLLIKYQFDPQRKSILMSIFLVRAQRRSYWPGRS